MAKDDIPERSATKAKDRAAGAIGRSLAAALRALTILGVVWAVLLLVGYVAGVLPPTSPEPGRTEAESHQAEPMPTEREPSVETESGNDTMASATAGNDTMASATAGNDTTGNDTTGVAGAAAGLAADDTADDTAEAGDESATANSPDTAEAAATAEATNTAIRSQLGHRHLVCEPTESAALAAGDVVGDAAPEWLVACGATLHVIGGTDRPLRVARVHWERASSLDQVARPAVGDVTGDGRNDLAIGYVAMGDASEPVGGAAHLIRGSAQGGLEVGARLAPIHAVDLQIADLDGQGGADVIAANWTDALGRRPSEVWTWRGGPSPVRRGVERVGADIVAIGAGDFDADGDRDLVALDAEGARMFLGAGDGRFDADVALPFPRGRSISVGPFTRPGADDILVVADGVHLLTPAKEEGSEDFAVQPIDAPVGVRRVVLANLDDDPRIDIVALLPDQIVGLLQADHLAVRERRLARLPANLSGTDVAVGGDTIGILARSAMGWEIVFVSRAGGEIEGPSDPQVVPDAPLSLELTIRR